MYTFGPWIPVLGYLVNMTLSPINIAKDRGLSRLRSSGREHISLLTHIHRLNLDHQGGALKFGQLRSRYKMGDVHTTHLS